MPNENQKKLRKMMDDDETPVVKKKRAIGTVVTASEKRSRKDVDMLHGQIQIDMKLSKDTPGTHVYAAIEDDAVITTLYIKRAAFDGNPPKKITITVE